MKRRPVHKKPQSPPWPLLVFYAVLGHVYIIWKLDAQGHFDKARAIRSAEPTKIAFVDDGLAWLKKHQDEDGRWDAAGFMKHDDADLPRCDGAGKETHDVGVTALALLAFLGDGSNMKTGRHKDVVRKAVKWLMQQQGEDGLFGTETAQEHMYGHALATLAMCEACYHSEYKALRAPAQKGIDYIQNARNPRRVWRYVPRGGDNDTSVTGWMVLALKCGEALDLHVDKRAFVAALDWLDDVTDPATGVAGYTRLGDRAPRRDGAGARFPLQKSEALTAAALLCRFQLGQDPGNTPVMRAAAETLLARPPVLNPDGSTDLNYWLHGSLAMFCLGGEHWRTWSERMKEGVLKTQRTDGNFKGSWDPVDPWGAEGGRVYSTALMVLCAQVYYRYGRVLLPR